LSRIACFLGIHLEYNRSDCQSIAFPTIKEKILTETAKVALSYTERHIFMSETIGDTFTINVALPKQYDPANKHYPVVYLTDANIFFGMVAETAWLLQYGQEIPEIILVAIGYPDDTQHLTLRNRDLGPTPYGESKPVGRAADFLSCLCDELKPFIKRKYAVNSQDSTLIGDSTGGLFALYVLFNRPQEFQRYIIGSPSIYWDNSVILQYERAYAEQHTSLPAKVFLSAGQLEAIYEPEFAGMLSNVAKLTERLTSRQYKDFTLISHIFLNETHLSVIPATMSRGLREVFQQ
jgi:predicted alpha/beta superfamily hydrolase